MVKVKCEAVFLKKLARLGAEELVEVRKPLNATVKLHSVFPREEHYEKALFPAVAVEQPTAAAVPSTFTHRGCWR